MFNVGGWLSSVDLVFCGAAELTSSRSFVDFLVFSTLTIMLSTNRESFICSFLNYMSFISFFFTNGNG